MAIAARMKAANLRIRPRPVGAAKLNYKGITADIAFDSRATDARPPDHLPVKNGKAGRQGLTDGSTARR
jgi:hypothetical protein